MKKRRYPHEDQYSFNLTATSRPQNRKTDAPKGEVPSWQEHAFDRLKVLYGTGKLLAAFDDIDVTFPKILALCANPFPFRSAVLIRKKGAKIFPTVWNSVLATPAQVEASMVRAKEAFIYLTGASESDALSLRAAPTASHVLESIHVLKSPEATPLENYFVLPLAVDHLPAFGILQLEGSAPLDEEDLEFVSALADLLAIGIDRVNKIQYERRRRDVEAKESQSKLSSSAAHILELESEREHREKFVSLLTHDLRTPLAAIRLNAQMVQDRHEARPEMVPVVANRIISSVDRADRMITDLLDANRIRSGGKLPLRLERFDLLLLIRESIGELAVVHGERFSLAPCRNVEGYWDRLGLRRIIENLCTNAVKYGAPRAPITISVDAIGGQVAISIHNLGEPILHEDQRHLFQQFHRSKKAEVSAKKGWGIGLTLVLGVAEAHGGTVKLKSEAQTGTVFTVTLPIDSRPFVFLPIDQEFGRLGVPPGPESSGCLHS